MSPKIVLNMAEINKVMAKNKMSVSILAEVYGVSRSRMHIILNSKTVTPICAGRLADALEVDATKIIM